LRSTAKAGDLILATGKLGTAALGLKLLENGEQYEKSKYEKLLIRQLAPQPQAEIGQILGTKSLATAMIDLSDGLSSDLAHLCRASNVGAKIFADKIPIDEDVKKFSMSKREEIEAEGKSEIQQSEDLLFALNGGEDFELLFTVNQKKISRLEKELKNFHFSCIGELTSNIEMIELVSANGMTILKPQGFRHF
jgi:thiamine-monophosphate kinase